MCGMSFFFGEGGVVLRCALLRASFGRDGGRRSPPVVIGRTPSPLAAIDHRPSPPISTPVVAPGGACPSPSTWSSEAAARQSGAWSPARPAAPARDPRAATSSACKARLLRARRRRCRGCCSQTRSARPARPAAPSPASAAPAPRPQCLRGVTRVGRLVGRPRQETSPEGAQPSPPIGALRFAPLPPSVTSSTANHAPFPPLLSMPGSGVTSASPSAEAELTAGCSPYLTQRLPREIWMRA